MVSRPPAPTEFEDRFAALTEREASLRSPSQGQSRVEFLRAKVSLIAEWTVLYEEYSTAVIWADAHTPAMASALRHAAAYQDQRAATYAEFLANAEARQARKASS